MNHPAGYIKARGVPGADGKRAGRPDANWWKVRRTFRREKLRRSENWWIRQKRQKNSRAPDIRERRTTGKPFVKNGERKPFEKKSGTGKIWRNVREDSEKKPEKKAPASPESWKPGAPERKEHKIWTTRSRG